MTEISVLSFMNNTYIAYADKSQFNSKLDKVSTWTCWAKGSLLFKLWYRLETSISSLETLTSVCGSSVFRPFSLNASIIFQISTECTVNKITISWLHNEDYYYYFDVLLSCVTVFNNTKPITKVNLSLHFVLLNINIVYQSHEDMKVVLCNL